MAEPSRGSSGNRTVKWKKIRRSLVGRGGNENGRVVGILFEAIVLFGCTISRFVRSNAIRDAIRLSRERKL